MRCRMALRCGAILGASQRRVTSTLVMKPARARTRRSGVGQEHVRSCTLPARIRVREVLADVAVADGAQQGIGERMQPDIGVGVPFEAVGMRDLDAAQPDVVARREAMHIEALTGAHIGKAVVRVLNHG